MSIPSIPKGTRDFTPLEMTRRNFIFDTIRSVFRLYGYESIETPAMENLSTLLGKYGEEGDKLIFKILNSGDFLGNAEISALTNKESSKLLKHISEKGLRYDLTVPFARYVVQHRNELMFPFKRYQIQPVWRADRPQKGRYREFYQCDVDVIGSDSLLNEVELIRITDEIFRRLGIRIVIKINNRKILAGIAEILGEPDRITDITVAIDKLDKIGLRGVNEELEQRGLSKEKILQLQPILHLQGSNRQKLGQLSEILDTSAIGLKGVTELETIIGYIDSLTIVSPVELDLTLARGLNYYTGAILEVKALDVPMGSISGGGRYDDLTGIFGLPGVSGVGISFGADRIYDVLNELNLFPSKTSSSAKVMLVNFGGEEEKVCLRYLHKLHEAGIPSQLYPEPAKMKKQFAFADNRNIEYCIIIGSEEAKTGEYKLKCMASGDQKIYSPEMLIEFLHESLES